MSLYIKNGVLKIIKEIVFFDKLNGLEKDHHKNDDWEQKKNIYCVCEK